MNPKPQTSAPIRIAMWSGPRNISTALLRSWGSRSDTAVVDEPLYAVYLAATGLDHPGRDAILAAQPTDWRKVAEQLTGSVPEGRPIFYQKHMAHHLLPEVGRAWLGGFRHAFLLREPRAMLVSLAKVLPHPPRAEDTGLPQQVELFERMRREHGGTPSVVDSRDVLLDPEGMLRALCEALGVPFDPAMLAWEAGSRPTDGVWAEHWYGTVEQSQGFAPPRPEGVVDVPEHLLDVLAECERHYAILHPHRLRATSVSR